MAKPQAEVFSSGGRACERSPPSPKIPGVNRARQGRPAKVSPALLAVALFIAPALAVMFAIISSSVRFSDTAEAYGWAGTGQLIGAAIGKTLDDSIEGTLRV